MNSATGLPGLESALLQLIEKQLNMITLDFDDTLLERATGAAAALERAGQLLEFILGKRYAGNGRHGLAATPLALATNAGDAITFGNHRFPASTGIHWLTAIRAVPPRIGGKNQPAKAG